MRLYVVNVSAIYNSTMDARPKVIVGRNYGNRLACSGRQVQEVRREHSIDQLLLCALYDSVQYDRTARTRTRSACDEMIDNCKRAGTWLATTDEGQWLRA